MKVIKKLRDKSGSGIMEVKKALDEAKGDEKKATTLLKKWGSERVAKRADKETNEGKVFSYVHHDERQVGVVKLLCETDFVAKLPEFEVLGKELAMQVVSMEPKNVKELLKQPFIRDNKKTIQDLVTETAAKVKEKLEVKEIVRVAV